MVATDRVVFSYVTALYVNRTKPESGCKSTCNRVCHVFSNLLEASSPLLFNKFDFDLIAPVIQPRS